MRHRYLYAITISLLLGGCSYDNLHSPRDSTTRIESLIDQQKYAAALRLVEQLTPEDQAFPSTAGYRAQISNLSRQQEKRTISNASRLEKENRWAEAIDSYQKTISRIPQSPALNKRYSELEDRHQQRLAELELNMLVARGTWLVQYRDLYDAYQQADPTFWALLLGPNSIEIAIVAEKLLKSGKEALTKGMLVDARRTLPLAAKLNPNLAGDPAHTVLNQQLAEQQRQLTERRQAKKRLEQESRKQEAARLLARYTEALETGQLIEAKQTFSELTTHLSKSRRVQIERHLKIEIDKAVTSDLDAANLLYSEGKFQQALPHWQRVLILDPDNRVAPGAIARTHRVMEKLQQLQEKKPVILPGSLPSQ